MSPVGNSPGIFMNTIPQAMRNRMKNIEGGWKLVKVITAGEPFNESAGILEVYGDRTFWRDWWGMQSPRFPYKIFESEGGIFEIDQFAEDGSVALLGLLKFENGQLIMCFADEVVHDRPSYFGSDETNGWNLSYWERCTEVPAREAGM